MDRRSFLKAAGLTSVALFAPWGFSKNAWAEGTTWGGPYFLHMHASGGWDPTLFCDAKLTAGGTTPVYENRIVTQVREINGIFVPTQTTGGAPFYLRENGMNGPAIEDPQNFFDTVGKDVLVINGVDTQTNNHDTGTQALACGHNDVELPALAALFAGLVAKERDVPMAFLADGPYNRTGDVVGISRFPGDKVELLINPYKGGGGNEEALISDVAVRKIQELRAKRYGDQEKKVTLPRTKRTFGAMRDASKGGASVNLLKSVVDAPDPAFDSLSAGLAPATADYWGEAAGNNSTRFIQDNRGLETILRCFQSGVTASATYQQGGFDTHSNHDNDQAESLGRFISQFRYVMLRAAQMGLKDKLFVMLTSDFGRTPKYNTGNGKDHWNVTSALLTGPGIRGGRALGKTDEGHKVMRVQRDNVSVTIPDADASGARIHPMHIHHELRRVLGVEKAAFINQFPLPSLAPSFLPLPLLA